MKIKSIVVPTDFSQTARAAVDQALMLTEKYQAELVLLHARVMYEDDPYEESETKKDHPQGRADEEVLQRMVTRTEAYNHLNIRHEIIRGYSAPSAILGYLNSNAFDLVVTGTHGRTGLGHFLIGSVAEKIVRYAPCPVLTVSSHAAKREQFDKIVVPFDFSEHSAYALQWALDMAESDRAEIDLVYVVDKDVHPALYSWGMKSIFEIIPDIAEKAKKRMDEMMADLTNSSGAKINKHVLEGVPHKEIARFIKGRESDLVVIATHGLVGLDRFLLGSTTERLIRSVQQPILTLKQKSLIE